MKIKHILSLILMLMACGLTATAQEQINIKGKVTDEFGNPLYNALIVSEYGVNRYVTNSDGSFDLDIRDKSTLVKVSMTGYKDQTCFIQDIFNGQDTIVLESDAQEADSYIDMAFFKTKKNHITGSVSTVGGRELEKTPSYRFQEAIQGKIFGLGTIEKDANPSIYDGALNYYIRGIHSPNGQTMSPIVMIDGVVDNAFLGGTHLFTFNPREIESITVIRDAATQAFYGFNAGDGIISIKTRRGEQGERRIQLSYDHSLRTMDTEWYHPYSAYEHAMMRNQACDNDGMKHVFSDSEIAMFKDGIYPNNNYWDEYMNRYTSLDKVYLSLNGGSEYVTYMCNFQWMHTGKLFKMPELHEPMAYKMNPGSADIFHVSSILDAKLNYFVSASFTLRGDFRIENGLGTAAGDRMRVRYEDMIQHCLVAAPTLTALYAPEGSYYNGRDISYMPLFSKNSTMTGIWGTSFPTNPYGELTKSGKTTEYSTYIYMDSKLHFDLYMITPGLKGEIGFAFQGGGSKDIDYGINYTSYQAMDMSNTSFRQLGDEYDTRGYSKYYSFCYNYQYHAKLFYEKYFNKDHYISATALGDHRESISGDIGGMNNIPYRVENWGLNAVYAYKDKYIVNGNLGYAGAGEFPANHRFFATPGVGAAWVISNEGFLKGNNFLSYLKLRGSYGVTPRLYFNQGRFAYNANVKVGSWDQGYMGNPNLEPEKVKGMDAGIDLTLFNSLSVSASIFKENMDNAYIKSTKLIPSFQGISLSNYTNRNAGKFENHGYEISVDYRKQFSKNFTLWAGAATWTNHNTVIDIGELPNDETYYERYNSEGHPYGSIKYFEIDGFDAGNPDLTGCLYNSKEEIENCGLDLTQIKATRPGDFKYVDQNGDGMISTKDMKFAEYGQIPEQFYSFNLGFRVKRVEVSALFYGAAKFMTNLANAYSYGYMNDGVYSDLQENAWTAERYAAGEPITAHALSMSNCASYETNDYYLRRGDFLKLKNAEIAYTLPEKVAKGMHAQEIRIALQGQNLFTWDKLPSKYIDPEVGTLGAFQPMKCVNASLNLTF